MSEYYSGGVVVSEPAVSSSGYAKFNTPATAATPGNNDPYGDRMAQGDITVNRGANPKRRYKILSKTNGDASLQIERLTSEEDLYIRQGDLVVLPLVERNGGGGAIERDPLANRKTKACNVLNTFRGTFVKPETQANYGAYADGFAFGGIAKTNFGPNATGRTFAVRMHGATTITPNGSDTIGPAQILRFEIPHPDAAIRYKKSEEHRAKGVVVDVAKPIISVEKPTDILSVGENLMSAYLKKYSNGQSSARDAFLLAEGQGDQQTSSTDKFFQTEFIKGTAEDLLNNIVLLSAMGLVTLNLPEEGEMANLSKLANLRSMTLEKLTERPAGSSGTREDMANGETKEYANQGAGNAKREERWSKIRVLAGMLGLSKISGVPTVASLLDMSMRMRYRGLIPVYGLMSDHISADVARFAPNPSSLDPVNQSLSTNQINRGRQAAVSFYEMYCRMTRYRFARSLGNAPAGSPVDVMIL